MINQNLNVSEYSGNGILPYILDASINGIIILNMSSQVVFWNLWMERHSNIEQSQAVGKELLMLFPLLKGKRIDSAIKNSLQHGNSTILSHALNRDPFPLCVDKHPDKAIKQSIFITPINTAENYRLCSIQIQDVTSSVQRENLLRTMAKEAEKAQREAEKLNKIKTEFISTVSHELRTPLTSILGSLGLICGGLTGKIPKETDALIQIAKKNGENLLTLINDLLDSDKIESGRMKLNLQPLEIMSFMDEALSRNNGFAITHNVKFKITKRIKNISINADELRLKQVMSNLLSNAAKFSPPQSTIEISVERTINNIRISITDHGPGIPEKFQSILFDKFTQSDSSDARKSGGTGLGLNITKAIVELHNGHIMFDTKMGEGTTFHIELPIN